MHNSDAKIRGTTAEKRKNESEIENLHHTLSKIIHTKINPSSGFQQTNVVLILKQTFWQC